MKRHVCILTFLILTFVSALGQVAELFHGFDLKNIQPGDSLAVEIKNTGSAPVTFYPLTVFDKPGNYLFLSEANYFAYLQAAGKKTDAIRAHARIMKSPFFVAGQTPVSETVNGSLLKEVAEKKYAFPQWFLTSCHYQCGEYAAMSNVVLTRSQLVHKDSIWGLNLSGYHTISEGILNSDTLTLDFDPNTPRLIDTLPNGTYASASDRSFYSDFIHRQAPFSICDENDSCWVNDECTDSVYSVFFQDESGIERYPANNIEPQNMSGAWTLCAGCSFVYEWKVPRYVLDMEDPATAALIDTALLLISEPEIDIAALGAVSKTLFETATASEGIDVLNNFNFIFAHELAELEHSTVFHYTATKIKLKIPRSSSPYSATDVQLPFAIKKVVSEKGLSIDGKIITPGIHEFKLWTEGLLEKEAPSTDPEGFLHLRGVQTGEDNAIEIELYCNQLIYGFLNGIKAELFSVTPSFSVNTYPPPSNIENQFR